GVRQMVEARGIAYHPQHQVSEVDPEMRMLKFSDGTEVAFDFLVYIPPHEAPAVVRESGLTNESGWVPVDRHSMETSHEGVFAIGDVTSIPLDMGLPLPKAGTFASGQAKVVAATIAARITGRGNEGSFDGFGECVVETGDGRAGIGRGNFYGTPAPTVKLRGPGRTWHWAKVWFEWRFLRRQF
ncbi:MAG: FAD/NAD(P)-binding oxidoreductase, partial [Dehalococcoidia bacterium]|nr:FAD/NAD(P)-binding oxidoreductase [Dehalococcoidia bacterium]